MNTNRILWSASLLLACAGAASAAEPAAADSAATKAAGCSMCNPDLTMSPTAEYLLSNQRLNPNDTILWPGFLNGLRGFEHFYDPIGQPIYFETPLNNSSARLLYLHHEFADHSQLSGGHLDVIAAQARVAITERLGFIATKDGYSMLRADALPEDEGWNDLAFGFKYVIYADKANDLLITPGIRYQMGNGDGEVLQGGVQEFSPFLSIAKGFGDFHILANITGRIPLEHDRGNDIVQWDVHFDYEVFPGVAPVIEFHGLHYLDDGDVLPFSVGGLDYANIGSGDVEGSTVIWMGAGARVKLTPNISVGSTFEFALTNRNADIMDNRVTVDVTLTW